MNAETMTPYYAYQLKEGQKYQDWCIRKLSNYNRLVERPLIRQEVKR